MKKLLVGAIAAVPNDYRQYLKYSPFYLKHHPEERQSGDIADIRSMAHAANLQSIELVFEKNEENFEALL